MLCHVCCVLDSFVHIVQTLLENEVYCTDEVQSPAVMKTSVAAIMPYVPTEVIVAIFLICYNLFVIVITVVFLYYGIHWL